MGLRRHRLPRIWLGVTLGLLASGVAGAYWWEQQLPSKIEQAARRGDLDACLRHSSQLEAFRWLGGTTPGEQGSCRRSKALLLWSQQRWGEALQMQLQLVNSLAGSKGDERRLITWQTELQQRALRLYRNGDLAGALALLELMGENRRADRTSLGDRLRQGWTRNRLQFERARGLVAQRRWWEALDALNRLDHPWWEKRASGLQSQVERAISQLDHDHGGQGNGGQDAHGPLPHMVPEAQLDAEVRKRLARGENDWAAFEAACRSLGGKVVEAGPETACQR